MKILVTGAAGFVGSHVVEDLLTAGHTVIGIDCLSDYYSPKLKLKTADALTTKGLELHTINLCDADLDPLLDGINAVFHLAAQPGNSSKVSLQTYVDNNIFATSRLLDACLKQAQLSAFVNISTSSVYGHFATQSEELPAMPVSNYGVTKLAAEQLVLAKARELGFPACSARLFSVYGPRERPDKLYPLAIKAIANGTKFPLFEGSLEHERSFTYVSDAASGIIALMHSIEKAAGEIFNIGSDKAITTKRGIEIVEEVMGDKLQTEILPPRPGDQKSTCANIEKAKSILGYDPKTLPEEGLRSMVSWYMDTIHDQVEYA